MYTTSNSHAVVIGGSIAGLLAARVLSNHFDQVSILERDRYPDSPGPRKGVPQAQHPHVLLTRGQLILEQLFPGLADELTAIGAPRVDAAEDIAWLTAFGWACRFRSGLSMLSASRSLLEWGIRRRVATLPGVRFLEQTDVVNLLSDASGTGVAGVTLERRGQNPTAYEPLAADLVVDASGRGSRAPRWLKNLGYGVPEETVVNPFLGYASRMYRRPATDIDWKALYVQVKHPGSRAGLILPVEGDQWMVMLGGRGGDNPPTDEAGFLEFARTLPSPLLHEAICNAEPLTPIAGYRGTENRLRHFERLERSPEGFVVLGDAACAFNPVYGQGMTMAALGALTLDECLREQAAQGGLARSFQKKLAAVNATPWLLATGEDFRYSTTEGGKPNWLTRLRQRYVDAVVRLGTERPDARLAMLQVIHLLKPPTSLFDSRLSLPILGRAVQSLMPCGWNRPAAAPAGSVPSGVLA